MTQSSMQLRNDKDISSTQLWTLNIQKVQLTIFTIGEEMEQT